MIYKKKIITIDIWQAQTKKKSNNKWHIGVGKVVGKIN